MSKNSIVNRSECYGLSFSSASVLALPWGYLSSLPLLRSFAPPLLRSFALPLLRSSFLPPPLSRLGFLICIPASIFLPPLRGAVPSPSL